MTVGKVLPAPPAPVSDVVMEDASIVAASPSTTSANVNAITSTGPTPTPLLPSSRVVTNSPRDAASLNPVAAHVDVPSEMIDFSQLTCRSFRTPARCAMIVIPKSALKAYPLPSNADPNGAVPNSKQAGTASDVDYEIDTSDADSDEEYYDSLTDEEYRNIRYFQRLNARAAAKSSTASSHRASTLRQRCQAQTPLQKTWARVSKGENSEENQNVADRMERRSDALQQRSDWMDVEGYRASMGVGKRYVEDQLLFRGIKTDSFEGTGTVDGKDADLVNRKVLGVEMEEWEDGINWDGAAPSTTSKIAEVHTLSKFHRPTNLALEALDLDAATNWEGSTSNHNSFTPANTPLILQQGVSGRSLSRQTLHTLRPTSFSRSQAFFFRYERELNGVHTFSSASTTSLPTNALSRNKEQMEAIIEERQRKRAAMAEAKSNRVVDAMGTLNIGGGKGRTITSSLMGPGGTERTGRPSRHSALTSAAHDAELVEQLDLVYNHTLARPDRTKGELRQWHRPRLVRSICRGQCVWKFQIRVEKQMAITKTSDNKSASSSASSSKVTDGCTVTAANPLMGTHPGAISQAKLRNEADLSAAEGMLLLLEYSEERPPIQMSKGMAAKIVNYYRGDRGKCPISAGGGDRPTKKRGGDKKEDAEDGDNTDTRSEAVAPLKGPGDIRDTAASLLTKLHPPPKPKTTHTCPTKPIPETLSKILPEGMTEMLYPKVHGPFIGEVEEGQTQSGLICNLFAAPIFCHDAEASDFLMILGKKPAYSLRRNEPTGLSVVLRPFPANVYCVGQTEPKVKVYAPNTTGEKNFLQLFVTYQIARHLTHTERNKDGRGLRFDEINDRLFANTNLLPNALRQRIKQVAIYDKNTQIWTSKDEGYDDYPGVELLGRKFNSEGVAAYEASCASVRRLQDLGLIELYSGVSSVEIVGKVMMYINGHLNASQKHKGKLLKMAEFARNNAKSLSNSNSSNNPNVINANMAVLLYEEAAAKAEKMWKEDKKLQEVALFIYEEIQLAPWHFGAEFIDVHKNAQGTAMMRLTGLGDPSGKGEAYNFLREQDAKPNKGTGNSDGALNAQIKKITGTENDLRKLTMKQMASLLRSYGMKQNDIDTLKRWDRVHCIRDLSTKAASDGMGDGMEKYARGEKMKLSDQKQMYRDRIREICRRQTKALSTDPGDARAAAAAKAAAAAAASTGGESGSAGTNMAASGEQSSADSAVSNEGGNAGQNDKKKVADEIPASAGGGSGNISSDDSDDDCDDFVADLEEDLINVRDTNVLIAENYKKDQSGGMGMLSGVGASALSHHTATDLSKDARELAALKRQREEERAAQEGMHGGNTNAADSKAIDELMGGGNSRASYLPNRKCIRRRVTTTFPDGTQTTTFTFITKPDEVDRIIKVKKKTEEKLAKQAKHGSSSLSSKSSKHSRKQGKKNNSSSGNNNNVIDSDDKDENYPEEITNHSMFDMDDDDANYHHSKGSSSRKLNPRITLKRVTEVKTIRMNKNSPSNRGLMRGSGGGSGDRDMAKLKKSLKMPSSKSSHHQSSSSSSSAKHILKSRHSKSQKEKEKRMKKRAKEREEADLYTKSASNSRYKQSTSNRRERGSARDKLPHVQLADRLEAIRLAVERRPNSADFHRPVPRRKIPRYYEVISKPIDLQTIRDKNSKYGYKTAQSFLRDFDLMMNNAIKFNGVGSVLGNEATAIYDSVKNAVENNRTEFDEIEQNVNDMNGGRNKRSKTSNVNSPASDDQKSSGDGSKTSSKNSSNNTASIMFQGVSATVNLGDIKQDESDSDDENELTPV